MQNEAAPGFIKHPQYKLEISPAVKSYQILYHGMQIAQSSNVIELYESGHSVRLYFPKADIQMATLSETDHNTYCPFKGTARYWTILSEGGDMENGVWAYDEPYAECHDLIDHLCFYTEKPGFELREISS